MGFTEVLTIIFVICKLINIIDWSWWLVLLPEIIAFSSYIVFLIIYSVCSIFLSLNKDEIKEHIKNKKAKKRESEK